jgi:hypothetical protein
VKSAASKSTSISSGPLRRDGSNSWPTISWMWGIVRSFTSNGQEISVRSPTHLYASQAAQKTPKTIAVVPALRRNGTTERLRGSTPRCTAAALDIGIAYHTPRPASASAELESRRCRSTLPALSQSCVSCVS